MIEPPSDSLERSVLEGLMAYKSSREKMISINSSLINVYGSILAGGGGDPTDIDDLIKEMGVGMSL